MMECYAASMHRLTNLLICCSPAVDDCASGWEECGDYYCFNGGTCQNDTCVCPEGFGGDYCLYSSGECLVDLLAYALSGSQCLELNAAEGTGFMLYVYLQWRHVVTTTASMEVHVRMGTVCVLKDLEENTANTALVSAY